MRSAHFQHTKGRIPMKKPLTAYNEALRILEEAEVAGALIIHGGKHLHAGLCQMSDTDKLKPSDLYEFAEMLMHMAQEIDARDSDCPCDECAIMRQRNRPN